MNMILPTSKVMPAQKQLPRIMVGSFGGFWDVRGFSTWVGMREESGFQTAKPTMGFALPRCLYGEVRSLGRSARARYGTLTSCIGVMDSFGRGDSEPVPASSRLF